MQQRKMFDPTDSELIHIHNMTVAFEKVVTRDPGAAKKMFQETLVPYMASQLRTIKILDDQLEGAEEQELMLLRSNAAMIDLCKRKGIDLPNFNQIEKDVRAELQIKRQGILKGIGG